MLIREAKREDLDGTNRLYRQLNPHDLTVSDGRDTAVLDTILASDCLYMFVGLIDGKIISTCYLNVIPNISRNTSPYGIIENVVTDGELRNRGYGKAILKHVLDFAWSKGCYKVMLQTGSKRESTYNFYKSCGFSSDDKIAFVARPA